MLPIFLNSPFRMAVSMACRRTGDSPAEAAVAVAQPSSPCRGLRDGGASWALVEMAGAKRRIRLFYVCAFVLASVPAVCRAQVDTRWKIHDRSRPVPPVIEPGTASTQEAPGRAPSDAVALFDGKDLSQWTQKKDGSPAKW